MTKRERLARDLGFWVPCCVSVLASLNIALAGPGVPMDGSWVVAIAAGVVAKLVWMADPDEPPRV